MIQMKNIVISLPLHYGWSILRSFKYIECMSVRYCLFTEYPMLSLNLLVDFSSGCDNDELSITHKLLNIRSRHESILLNEFWWVHIIPFISVNLISVGHDKIDVIIEANSINSEPVHVHFDFEEVSGEDSLVWSQNDLKQSFVVSKKVKVTKRNLVIDN